MVDLGVQLGVQHRERQVLELPAHFLDAEAVRERRVDVERLLRGAALLPHRHRGDGAHVVQPVGELDDQDPPVLRHRDEHLAHRRGLLGFLGVERDAIQLGNAVDHRRHDRPELLGDVVEGERGVFDRVVQQRGGDGDVVEPEAGHDAGHGDRVVDVGLARLTGLVAVGLGGAVEGPQDQAGVALGVTLLVGIDDRRDQRVRRSGLAPRQTRDRPWPRPALLVA